MLETLRRSGLALLALAAASAALPAQSDTLVIPSIYENADGNSNLSFPLAQVTLPIPSNYPYQYEQVYGADQFGAPAEPIYITAIRFRVDQNNGDRNAFDVLHVELTVGTSTKGPDELTSLSTGSNIDGGDATLVFSGPLSFDPCDVDVCALPAFDIEIPFTEPFVYDPATGDNLIVNVLNFNETNTFPIQFFDAAQTDADGVSSVREVLERANPSNHIFQNPSTVGLVTQFAYTVPEPGALASIATALAAIATLRRSRA